MNWINVTQDRDRWQALVKIEMKLQFQKMQGISWLADDLFASEEGLWSMEFVITRPANRSKH
jgi:hypothetical protein